MTNTRTILQGRIQEEGKFGRSYLYQTLIADHVRSGEPVLELAWLLSDMINDIITQAGIQVVKKNAHLTSPSDNARERESNDLTAIGLLPPCVREILRSIALPSVPFMDLPKLINALHHILKAPVWDVCALLIGIVQQDVDDAVKEIQKVLQKDFDAKSLLERAKREADLATAAPTAILKLIKCY